MWNETQSLTRATGSRQSHGQPQKRTSGPTVAIATSDAGKRTRPARSWRTIGRAWTTRACGTKTAGRIHALCFVRSVSP